MVYFYSSIKFSIAPSFLIVHALRRLTVMHYAVSSAAPALQATEKELKKAQLVTQLERSLNDRPDRQELADHNIIPDTRAAPALQATEQALARELVVDALGAQLADRPSLENLREHQILDGSPTAQDEDQTNTSTAYENVTGDDADEASLFCA